MGGKNSKTTEAGEIDAFQESLSAEEILRLALASEATVDVFVKLKPGTGTYGVLVGYDVTLVANPRAKEPGQEPMSEVEAVIIEREGFYQRILMREGIYQGLMGARVGDQVWILLENGPDRVTLSNRKVPPYKAFFKASDPTRKNETLVSVNRRQLNNMINGADAPAPKILPGGIIDTEFNQAEQKSLPAQKN